MSMPNLTNVEAEILGACLLSASVIDRLAIDCELLPEDFSAAPYQQAWDAILRLHERDGTVTAATLAAALSNEALVNELVVATGPVGAIIPNGRLVKRGSLRRTWKAAAYQLLEAAESDNECLVAQAEQTLATPTVTEDTHSAKDVADATLRFLSDSGTVGISTGFPALDNTIGGGLRPGDSTALGAWTSMGKSVLVDQILTVAAIGGARCHAYINEMSVVDRGLRMLARQTSVPYSRIVIRDLDEREREIVSRAAQRMPFGITDCAQWSAGQIARHIRANRWDLCTVDLLHNMAYERESELHQIVSTLAAAARTASCHLILVCQFNEARAVSDMLPRPVARDLRGSGMIKNICANVLLLHREQTNEGGFVVTTNHATLNIDKARHGQRNALSLWFDADTMSFDRPRPRAAVAA